jgi:hypothetical protein
MRLVLTVLTCGAFALLTACGGGSSSATTTTNGGAGTSGPNSTVQGVTTPSSVAVVTAR